jgi:hypothetical protein
MRSNVLHLLILYIRCKWRASELEGLMFVPNTYLKLQDREYLILLCLKEVILSNC